MEIQKFINVPTWIKVGLGATTTLLATVFGYLATTWRSPIFIGIACLTLVGLVMVANIRNSPPANRLGDFVAVNLAIKLFGLVTCLLIAAALGQRMTTANPLEMVAIGVIALLLAILTGVVTTLEGKEA